MPDWDEDEGDEAGRFDIEAVGGAGITLRIISVVVKEGLAMSLYDSIMMKSDGVV